MGGNRRYALGSLLAGLCFVAGVVLYVMNIDARIQSLEENIRRSLQVDVHAKPINFAINAAIFNSWENAVAGTHTRYITASGSGPAESKLKWAVGLNGTEGTFSYRVDSQITPEGNESSGGWVAFYEDPIDRLRYRSVSLRCKVEKADGVPDVGIRLVVDNPGSTGDRELVVYELSSLAAIAPLTTDWQLYDIDLAHFVLKTSRPPMPKGLDANTVNKIVFFVTPGIAERCDGATLSFRDVEFQPAQIQSLVPTATAR